MRTTNYISFFTIPFLLTEPIENITEIGIDAQKSLNFSRKRILQKAKVVDVENVFCIKLFYKFFEL